MSPGRGDLKLAEKAEPLPRELKGKQYDDPLVKKAYLNYWPGARKAQRDGDEKLVNRLADDAKQLLGDDAGVPETPDQYREAPPTVSRLSNEELAKSFDHYLREIKRRKWWHIGEDPMKSDHKPREVASVIIGCCSAYRANCNNKGELLRIAKEAGDYLIGCLVYATSTASRAQHEVEVPVVGGGRRTGGKPAG